MPEHMTNLVDALGTIMVNIKMPKGKKIKSIFKRKQKKSEPRTYQAPDGKGGFITVQEAE